MNFRKHITAKNTKSSCLQFTPQGPEVASTGAFATEKAESSSMLVSSSLLAMHEHCPKALVPFLLALVLQPAWQAEVYVSPSSPQTGEYLTKSQWQSELHTSLVSWWILKVLSLSAQPMKAYEIMPTTQQKPQITCHIVRNLADGLNFDMNIPPTRTPTPEKTIANVPV